MGYVSDVSSDLHMCIQDSASMKGPGGSSRGSSLLRPLVILVPVSLHTSLHTYVWYIYQYYCNVSILLFSKLVELEVHIAVYIYTVLLSPSDNLHHLQMLDSFVQRLTLCVLYNPPTLVEFSLFPKVRASVYVLSHLSIFSQSFRGFEDSHRTTTDFTTTDFLIYIRVRLFWVRLATTLQEFIFLCSVCSVCSVCSLAWRD